MSKKNNRSSGDGSSNYEVGYGKPPVHTRFKKGQSGNPSGQRKKAKSWPELFKEVLGSEVNIELPTGKQPMSLREIVVRQLIKKATEGNMPAMKLLLQYETLFALSPEPEDVTMRFTLKLEENDSREHWSFVPTIPE